MGYEPKEFIYTPFSYKDYEKSAEVQAAEAKQKEIENAVANYGNFVWADQEKYNNLLSNYENRPDFTYDFNADALYQQYKDKYIQHGKMAMADTMGQAAAMTGGYGNSYAQTVGNQAYQASLQNLNDIIPELYQMAYDRYNQKGQDMLNMIGLLSNERDYALGLHNDGYDKLVNDRTYYSTEAQNAFNRDYGMYSADREIAQGEHTNEQHYAYQAVADANAYAQWAAEQSLREQENSAKYGTKQTTGTPKTEDDDEGDEPKVETFTPQNTEAVKSFKAGIRTKAEFNRSAQDKKTYKTYSAYIEGMLDKWLSNGKLNEQEVATLLTYYGL